ncbi:MAG: hypothetical protein WCP01_12955 [Methylococcaceae bacterium]|jgi:phosphoenolpyruvate synthase/pyruvate phosphate dikinase
MKTTDAYRQRLLTELIEHSAQIDALVIKSQHTETDIKLIVEQELEVLRAKQQITTKKLHQLEDSDINVWENIGDGG